MTPDCRVLLLGFQHKIPLREIVRIFQRKTKTLPTRIGAVFSRLSGLMLHRREHPENANLGVPDQRQSGREAVGAAVKATRAEAIAAAAPQQDKTLPAEPCEEHRRVRDEQRIKGGGAEQ
jgi:hypothetical protein